MADNPYAVANLNDGTARPAVGNSVQEIARAVFLDWEKLRPLFIGLLAVPTVGFIVIAGVPDPSVYVMIVFGAAVSNLCYFAGPIIETYMRWLGLRSLMPRIIMFSCGTLVTAVAAILSLGTLLQLF